MSTKDYNPSPESGLPIGGRAFARQTRSMNQETENAAITANINAETAISIANAARNKADEVDADLIVHINNPINVHGATPDPTPLRIVTRDSQGNAQINTPVVRQDIANKGFVDDIDSRLSGHINDINNQLENVNTDIGGINSGLTALNTRVNTAVGNANQALAVAQTALGSYIIIEDGISCDANIYFDEPNKFYVKATDLANFPTGITPPFYFDIIISEDETSVLQWVRTQDNTQSFQRTGTVSGDTVTFTQWENTEGVDYATNETAAAGTVSDQAISPATLNYAMSQFGLFGYAKTYRDITEFSSWNEFLQTGFFCVTYAVASRLTDGPPGGRTGYNLTVIISDTESPSVVSQHVVSVNIDPMVAYMRYGTPSTGTWTDWMQLYPALSTATNAQAIAGVDTSVTLSPANLKAAMSQFGLFGSSRVYYDTSIISSLNELTATGFYYCSGHSGIANVPRTDYATSIYVSAAIEGNYVTQLAVSLGNLSVELGGIFLRYSWAGTWFDWVQLVTEPSSFSTASTRSEEIQKELETIDSTYRTPRLLASAALGDEYALEKLKVAEMLAVPLREELAALPDESSAEISPEAFVEPELTAVKKKRTSRKKSE